MAYSTTPSSSVSITINQSGFTSSDVGITSKMNLHNIDHSTGCKKSTGLKRIKGTDNSNAGVLLFDMSSFGAGSACRAYLYIKNPNTTTKGTRKFQVWETNVSGTMICELYEQDFLYLPVAGHNGCDITVHSDDDTWFLEYMIIYESADAGYIPGQEL
jgi:hypothetical protein